MTATPASPGHPVTLQTPELRRVELGLGVRGYIAGGGGTVIGVVFVFEIDPKQDTRGTSNDVTVP